MPPRKRTQPKPEPLTVVESTAVFIASLPESVRVSPEARLAEQLAAVALSTDSARDIATVTKELRSTLADLRVAADALGDLGDGVDDLRARRDSRRTAAG